MAEGWGRRKGQVATHLKRPGMDTAASDRGGPTLHKLTAQWGKGQASRGLQAAERAQEALVRVQGQSTSQGGLTMPCYGCLGGSIPLLSWATRPFPILCLNSPLRKTVYDATSPSIREARTGVPKAPRAQ